jgi:hypothetical protein
VRTASETPVPDGWAAVILATVQQIEWRPWRIELVELNPAHDSSKGEEFVMREPASLEIFFGAHAQD